MKKISMVLLFFTMRFLISAHDFSSSCGGGTVYLDINTNGKKIVNGNTAFVKGNFKLSGDYKADSLYDPSGTE